MPFLLDGLFYYFWVAPHILLLAVLWLLVKRGMPRRFPILTAYILLELLQFGVLFALGRTHSLSASPYKLFFLMGTAASAALRFGIIYEVSMDVLQRYPAISSIGKQVLRWTAAALLLLGAVLATIGGSSAAFMGSFWVLDRTVSLLQCGLLVVLLVCARYLNLSWRNYGFGIATGFGIYESFNLGRAALRAESSSHIGLIDLLCMAAYHVCVLVWIFYLARTEAAGQGLVVNIPEHDMESWNQELRRLVR